MFPRRRPPRTLLRPPRTMTQRCREACQVAKTQWPRVHACTRAHILQCPAAVRKTAMLPWQRSWFHSTERKGGSEIAVSLKPRSPRSGPWSCKKTLSFNEFSVLFQLQKTEITSWDPSPNNEVRSGMEAYKVHMQMCRFQPAATNRSIQRRKRGRITAWFSRGREEEKEHLSYTHGHTHETAQALAKQVGTQRACPAGIPGIWTALAPW